MKKIIFKILGITVGIILILFFAWFVLLAFYPQLFMGYTKISHKVYYWPEDVKAVFPVAEMKRCIAAGKERKCNVTNQPTNRYLIYE